MHKRELNIIVNKEDNAIKRGDFFEEIVSNIFKTQRYTIKERVNFTGMEIDLIAQHIDRKNEINSFKAINFSSLIVIFSDYRKYL